MTTTGSYYPFGLSALSCIYLRAYTAMYRYSHPISCPQMSLVLVLATSHDHLSHFSSIQHSIP